MSRTNTLLAYADGSCIGNPGPGGWGVVIVEANGARRELGGGAPETTNNRMELAAAIEALRQIDPASKVVLRSDSEYLVKGINEARKRRKNVDLWVQLDAEVGRREVRFEWVRGHGDDSLNDRADELAREQAEKFARAADSAHRSLAAGSRTRAAEDAMRELRQMLRQDETIRRCAGCGRVFVSRRAHYCSHVACQLQARRAMKAD